MLLSLGLDNFKSFECLSPQPIAGVTLLCGSNSCGKSTILQALLLLKQSIEQPSRAALTLNGCLARMGSYTELVSGKRTRERLKYTLELEGLEQLALVYSGAADPAFPTIVSVEILHEDVWVRLNDRGVRIELEDESWLKWNRRIFDPTNTFGLLPGAELTGAPDSSHLEDGTDTQEATKRALEVFEHVVERVRAFRHWLTESVSYLGPVRASPERFYLVEELPRIGPLGENTIAVLSRRWSEERLTTRPPDGVNRMRAPLGTSVQRWLRELGFRYQLSHKSESDVLFELQLKLPNFGRGKTVSPRDVGYGLSQVLPVVVAGHLAAPGDLLLLEQPELHLHPAVQARLGDFLVSLARTGKSVLAESHSEHIVTRLRRRVAEDPNDHLAETVRVLFVEQEPGGWRSSIRPLVFDRLGGLIDWPAGFFDHTEDEYEAISRAAVSKLRPEGGGGT
jgi:predicted ATPase